MSTAEAAILSEIDALRTRGEAEGFVELATELGEMNARLNDVLRAVELDEAVRLMREFYPLVFAGMVELGRTDPELKEKLAKTQDVVYVLKVEEADFALCLKIDKGEFAYSFEEPANVHVTMTTTPEILLDIMSGQTDAIEAFMAGDVEAEGEIVKARSLRAVFEALGDRFGFQIMQF
jgi:putative sterol carrier protein